MAVALELEDSDDEFGAFDDDLDELAMLEADVLAGRKFAPKSVVSVPGLKQRDLFGGIVAAPVARAPAQGPPGTQTVAKVRVTKKWDRASFAKHGWSKKNAKATKAKARGKGNGKGNGKGKGKAHGSDEEPWGDDEDVLDDDDDDDETLLDTSYDPDAAPLPIKWPPDAEAAKTWQYPVQADKPLRTYQYNIVYQCLFANTLVSLPTGLGKTFIAACIMLNFYRWYPRGTIIFLAPTRPLVTQQIKACHYIAGIPQEHCVELTGHTAPTLRAIAWKSKRVVYCTPQTLENDLAKGRVDPRDITCLVVDEAHRASGDYAYVGVVRYIMSRNEHFRVLALTATPGSKGEAVQNVIDNLHISKIEVRTDESIDIRRYMHTKEYDLQVVSLGPILTSIRDRWAKLMGVYHGPLLKARLVYESNPIFLTPYGVQMANQKIKGLPGNARENSKYYPMIKTLATMARAMEYLVIQSLTEFRRILQDLDAEGPKTLVAQSAFRDILRETNDHRARDGYVGHPKMGTLRDMCADHFERCAKEVDPDTGAPVETRVMVFCNYRAVVDEIVDCLNQQRPLIKATAFVGQGTAKGVKGMTQKDQIETIKKFKAGTYNVLVASSIGEEGLDIGEIDLIVCYEANKSPIRMLQRVGRTGRARDGTIIVLMTEGREEKNWDKAKEAYNEVQNALISNKIFELYVDCDRMLPKEMKPEVEKVEIKALPLDMPTMTMAGQDRLERKTTAAAKKKEQKKRDPTLNVPNDAFDGFRTAGQLLHAAVPSPGKDLRERKKAALLTTEQETELRERWQFSGDEKIRPVILDPSRLSFERGNTGSALRIPMHSSRHLDALKLLKTYERLDESHPDNFDVWNAEMNAAFNPKLIQFWDAEAHKDAPRRVHKSLRRPSPAPNPPTSSAPLPPSPAKTKATAPPSSSPGQTSGFSKLAAFRRVSPPPDDDDSPPPAKRARIASPTPPHPPPAKTTSHRAPRSPIAAETSQNRAFSPESSPPLSSIPLGIPPPPRPQAAGQPKKAPVTETIVIDSDDDDDAAESLKEKEKEEEEEDEFDFGGDDLDLGDVSDSQLLEGEGEAVIEDSEDF